MRRRALGVLLLVAVSLVGCAATPRHAEALSQRVVVERYLDALNRRDLLVLTAYVTPDVEWYSVVDGKRITEVSGRDALTQMLQTFFARTAHASWHIESALEQERYLAVRELSQWQDADGTGERTSLCVYEFDDGRIRRITYFLN